MIEKNTRLGLTLFLIAVVGLFVYSHFHVPGHPLLDIVPAETMRIILSLALAGASLFIIIRKDYGPKDKHWAYATIGTILGFWLRGDSK